jgi:hypothetical protein
MRSLKGRCQIATYNGGRGEGWGVESLSGVHEGYITTFHPITIDNISRSLSGIGQVTNQPRLFACNTIVKQNLAARRQLSDTHYYPTRRLSVWPSMPKVPTSKPARGKFPVHRRTAKVVSEPGCGPGRVLGGGVVLS